MDNQHTKHQHYVPKFYLKNFTSQDEKLFVWDRVKKRCFQKNIREICYENDLYEQKWENENAKTGKYVLDNQIEKQLGELETKSAQIVRKALNAVKHKEIYLNDEEREVLLEFIATLYLRHPFILREIKDYYDGVESEKQLEALRVVVEYLLNNGEYGDSKSLFDYSIVASVFNKDIPGSPINVEMKRLRAMNFCFCQSDDEDFVTSSFPLLINSSTNRGTQQIFLPISKNVACVLMSEQPKKDTIKVNPGFVVELNSLYERLYTPELNRFIIANKKESIYKIV